MNRGVEKILDYLRRRTATEEELEAADEIERQAAQIEMMRDAIPEGWVLDARFKFTPRKD